MIGTRLAHYEITGHLGSGGMGDVYQASDSKLGRSVAIKLLPEAFTHDADRAARFEREARALASFNHPNIAAIHGLEESGGRKFLVMELVTGETLAERIRKGPIPLDEALPIAKLIAEALEAAHEKGIVHRDLKPANIKITPQGQVKVLDFGLAKAFAGEAAHVNLSNSPTLSMAATNAGVILGTAAYMSPEQAKGKETDRSTDIWAFGCVLYEMLTGRAAFEGETLGEILGSVFKAEPDWNRLPVETPSSIRWLLSRSLRKDRHVRLRDAADARLEIMEPPGETIPVASHAKARERIAWIGVAAATVGLALLAVMYIRMASVEIPETRLEISTPPGRLSFISLSPDGRKILFSAAAEGEPPQLWLRRFESETAQPLAGTENAEFPFWSPDSRSIGFTASGKLMRLDLSGGSARPLADSNGPGGAWGPDNTILFTPTITSPLYRVPAIGGSPVEVTHLSAPAQASHRYPQWLPDGRHFLFAVRGTPDVQGAYIGSLDSLETRRLLDADSAAVFAEPDHVLFLRGENLVAQRLDLKRFELTGDSFSVAEQVSGQQGTGYEIAVSTSSSGLIAYRAPLSDPRQLTWFDRAGRETGIISDVDPFAVPAPPVALRGNIRISPDGSIIGIPRRIKGNLDLWLVETARGIRSRFTSDPAIEDMPVWHPDGKRIAFVSGRFGANSLWQKRIDGGTEEPLREMVRTQAEVSTDWSPNGQFLLFAIGSVDLWALSLEGDRKAVPVANTNAVEINGCFSPNGLWVAYQSDETGRNEIYIVPFPGPGVPIPVSTNGGVNPRWREGEIFYVDPANRLVHVPVTPQPDGKLKAGTPTPLFTIPQEATYDITRDGKRILINKPVGQATTPPITIIQNWKPESRSQLGANQ